MLPIQDIETTLNTTLSQDKRTEIENLKEESIKGLRKNLIGQTFNNLLVIGRAPSDYSPSADKYFTKYWCICSCSNHTILAVRAGNLQSGNTKSCGCHRRKVMQEIGKQNSRLNLLGQTFGDLTVLEDTNTQNNQRAEIWKCQCSCGNICYAITAELTTGRKTSCGHDYRSKGAKIIETILQENNIPFIKEKCFPTCKFPDTLASARFDYYINNEFLLEYDGEQHFQERDSSFFRDPLEKRKQHDEFKTAWCFENNIPLKRIPYTRLKDISLASIMGDEFLV